MPGNRHWTDEETNLLRRNYWRGARTAQQILHQHGHPRTLSAVRSRAHQLQLLPNPKNLVPCCDVHYYERSKRIAHRLMTRAKRDGVLTDRGPNARPRYYVPEEWADQYTESLGDGLEAKRAGWLTLTQVSDEIGISLGYLSDALTSRRKVGGYIRRALHGARTKINPLTHSVLYHPGDVRRAAERINALREERAA